MLINKNSWHYKLNTYFDFFIVPPATVPWYWTQTTLLISVLLITSPIWLLYHVLLAALTLIVVTMPEWLNSIGQKITYKD